jgi:uncharacterized iron-regulated protein
VRCLHNPFLAVFGLENLLEILEHSSYLWIKTPKEIERICTFVSLAVWIYFKYSKNTFVAVIFEKVSNQGITMNNLKFLLLLISFFTVNELFAQKGKEAYIIFSSNGKKTNFQSIEKQALLSDFVFFGEYHDNPISHWLQLELTQSMHSKFKANLMLGFEMFEQDQQAILDAYVKGKMDEKNFKDSCRLWPNYSTDYKPLVDFAKENKLKCIASNVQRKYASLLFKKGRQALDTLSPLIKSQMADIQFPIDTTLSQYRAVREMGGHAMGLNMVEAQAFKDASMAKFILVNSKPDSKMIHFNGAFHSDFYQGILWYLKKEKPAAKILTITTVTQTQLNTLDKEHLKKADFIICVPESMTRTH